MLREAFCTNCTRTLYQGTDDGDHCPVCSTPLIVTSVESPVEPTVTKTGPVIPANEGLRLAAVNRYDILDTPADGAFDRVAGLAAKIFDVPIATITVVDHDRIWFKAKHGIDAVEIGRDAGLCASAVLQDDVWVINDAVNDPRALENPLVRGDLGLRFYAGAPLKTADGYNLGTLNIIDTKPREIPDDHLKMLSDLAEIVVDEHELRLAALHLVRDAREQGVQLSA